MRRLVLGIDRNRQRLDRVHVKVGNLFNVLKLLALRARDLSNPLLIKAIKQMDKCRDQKSHEKKWYARTVERAIKHGSRSDICDLRDQSPNQTLLREADANTGTEHTRRKDAGGSETVMY